MKQSEFLMLITNGNCILDCILFLRKLTFKLEINRTNNNDVTLQIPQKKVYTRLTSATKNAGNAFTVLSKKCNYNLQYKAVVLKLESHIVSCIVQELYFSRIFCKRFYRTQCRQICDAHADSDSVRVTRVKPPATSQTDHVIVMRVIYPTQKIDYAWNEKIQLLVAKHVYIQENMAWLSTLGGGFSALGDYFLHHSEVAAKISLRQLKLSLEMGDPIMAAKSRLFFAQSLMQRGYLCAAKRLIRVQFEYGKKLGENDDRLRWMCKGVWNRLKYLYKLQTQHLYKSGCI